MERGREKKKKPTDTTGGVRRDDGGGCGEGEERAQGGWIERHNRIVFNIVGGGGCIARSGEEDARVSTHNLYLLDMKLQFEGETLQHIKPFSVLV